MAPWWLRTNEDETPYEDELPLMTDEEALALIGRADEGDTSPAGAPDEEAFAIGWDPEPPDRSPTERSPTERPPPESTTKPPASASGGDEAPVKKKKRRRRRRKKKSEPASEVAFQAEAPAKSTETRTRAPEAEPIAGLDPLALDEISFDLPERLPTGSDERKIALFCDLENIALGVRNSEIKKFDINLVLERLLEKGKIIVKKAYADWERYNDYKRTFHAAAVELIDIPQKHYSGKNSADIKMVVDAMDLCYSKEHLDTFVVLSGDSDFSPLVSKLKENNKYVIGVGVRNSTSNLLIDNCDEFIYYEDVWRDIQRAPRLDHLSPKEAEVFGLLIDSILALARENKAVLWGSMIKQTMQRKRPSFSEGYYGYSSFSDLLEDAQKKDIIRIKKEPRSGNYAVTGFGKS